METAKTPIARIRLPSHHSAINGAKDGHKLVLHVEHVPPPAPPRGMEDMRDTKGPQPPPLEQDYHVMHIGPHKGKAADNEGEERGETPAEEAAEGETVKSGNPIAAIKAKRAAGKGY